MSQQAISFALNGGGRLSDETRKFILDEAKKVGYRNNVASRMFRDGKTNSIALILPGSFHTLSRLMLNDMRPQLRDYDINLTLFGAVKSDFEDPDNPPRLLHEKGVDGFLLMYDGRGTNMMQEIARYRIPSVWINENKSKNAVYPDERFLASKLVRELALRKQGNFLYYGLDHEGKKHYSIEARKKGFLRGIEEVGRKGELFTDVSDYLDLDTKRNQIGGFLRRKRNKPSIVITYSQEHAEMFYLEALLSGLRVPEDILICTFAQESLVFARRVIPHVLVPLHACGYKGVEMLLKRIESPDLECRSVAVREFQLHGV